MNARALRAEVIADLLVLAALVLIFVGLHRLWGIGVMCLGGGAAVGALGVLMGRGSTRGEVGR